MDGIARRRGSRDKELRQLSLEARAIADLMEGVRGALPRRPELVDEVGDAPLLALQGSAAERVERADGRDQIGSSLLPHDHCRKRSVFEQLQRSRFQGSANGHGDSGIGSSLAPLACGYKHPA